MGKPSIKSFLYLNKAIDQVTTAGQARQFGLSFPLVRWGGVVLGFDGMDREMADATGKEASHGGPWDAETKP